MGKTADDPLLTVWRNNHRTTVYFFEHVSEELWSCRGPGAPRRTVRMIAGHIHNCRCTWIKTLGKKANIRAPKPVDRHKVTGKALLAALGKSDKGMQQIIRFGLENDGKLTGFPPDVTHFVTYMIAHEAHHRGQICLVAREAGMPLARAVTDGLWHWSKRAREAAE